MRGPSLRVRSVLAAEARVPAPALPVPAGRPGARVPLRVVETQPDRLRGGAGEGTVTWRDLDSHPWQQQPGPRPLRRPLRWVRAGGRIAGPV